MKLTGSGFPRAEACPPSTFLPFVHQPDTSASKRGTAVHKFLCLVCEVGHEAALGLMASDEHYEDLKAIDIVRLPHAQPDAWAAEVALAWNPTTDTARELYRGSGKRDYSSCTTDEYAGTLDVVAIDGDCFVYLDVKTGWGNLAAPRDALQLGFGAVAGARAYGCTRATVGWIRLVDGEPVFQVDELDELDLNAMAERLRRVIEAATIAEADFEASGRDLSTITPVQGEHCRYCPVFLRCPANATLLSAIAANDPVAPAVIDESVIPQTLERIWAFRKVLDAVEKNINDYAHAHPVPMPDGKIYGPVEMSRESLDPVIGGNVIANMFGDEMARTAVEEKLELTKASVERVSRIVAEREKRKISHVEKEVLEAIRAAGGSKAPKYLTVKLHKPKQLKP